MKNLFMTTVVLLCTVLTYAQRDAAKYRERAEEVRTEIWGTPEAPFRVKEVPEAMKNESAVILARNFEIINSSKVKLKLSIFGLGAARRISYRTTLHERVYIGDKAALDEFSSIEYKKKLDKTSSYGFARIYDKMDSYIGAKIIKPGGKEIIVNTDEEVLTRNSSKDKEGKLAISDLQVGDVLDYFIRVEEMRENSAEEQGPYSFVMGGEYPMIYYKVRLQLDDKVNVKYITANGAPSFRESTTDDGDFLLELTQKNLPKFESQMWTSAWRQWPYLILTYQFVGKRGEVKKGYMSEDIIKNVKAALPYMGPNINWSPLNYTYDYFGGKKKIKDFPQDTVVKVLYDAWKFATFCSFNMEKIDITNDLNYNTANSLMGAISMSYFLRTLEIDHDIVLTCSRFSSSMKNVMNLGDFDGLIRLNGGKQWMAFDDMVTQFNEIPSRFQGEDAITLHPEVLRRSVEYYDSKTKIPVTTDKDNTIVEDIQVALGSPNMQQLKIDRTCSLTGAMRHGEQKRLLLLEEMEAEFAGAVNQKKLSERLAENKKSEKAVVEFAAAFEKEKGELKTYFKDEAQEQFEEEPKDIAAYEVKSKALLRNQKTFEYRSSFSLDNFVKKAGNNFIVDAGRLIGKFSKVEEKDRKRTIDVYMSCARSFTYNITLKIPEGYNVKGVEDLAASVVNETGSFTVKPVTEGQVIRIQVTRTFSRQFETAANWSKLVELLDAAYTFNNKKILFEKKK
ncbi:MAG TPA: hypothetical protein VF145_12265 [Chitinophagaceae bacterium]